MAEKTLKQIVEDREAELNARYTRMDTDRALFNLDKYRMLDLDSREMANVWNMTSTGPRRFAKKVLSKLRSAHKQVVVELPGADQAQASKIEKFLDAHEEYSNDGLMRGRFPTIDDACCDQLAFRGTMAGRIYPTLNKETYDAGEKPWDARKVAYDDDVDGLLWASYRTIKTRDQILSQWPDVQVGNGKTFDVLDIWTRDKNEVWVADNTAYVFEHKLGYVPVVIVLTGSTPYLRDLGWEQYAGESIYETLRDLYQDFNRYLSVLNTINMRSFANATQFANENGNEAVVSASELYNWDGVFPTGLQDRFYKLPINDLQRASQLLYTIIDKEIQLGSLPPYEYGEIDFPLSAVAIESLKESSDDVYLPILNARAWFNRLRHKMLIRQLIEREIVPVIKKAGQEIKMPVDVLKGDYELTYRFNSVSKVQKIATFSVAQVAANWLSEDTIDREILEVQDPEGEHDKKLAQEARRAVPELAALEWGRALANRGDAQAAKLIAKKLGITYKQMMTGQIEPLKVPQQQQPNPQQGMPLTGEGQVSSHRKAAQMGKALGTEVPGAQTQV